MIHYHGIAGVSHKFLATVISGRHAFVSYAHPGNLEHVADICSTFALDNGAFTAWKKKVSFDFAGFKEWVEEWEQHPAYDFHLIPDVIDGQEKENRKLVDSWTLKNGVPVWHMHESIEFLSDLCRGFDRVAIGSSGQFATIGTRQWWERINTAMVAICDDGKPPCKLHGLRMLRIDIFSKLPFHSADSTTVVRDSKYCANWKGYNAPKSPHMRGLVIADRLESHQAAARWESMPEQQRLFC